MDGLPPVPEEVMPALFGNVGMIVMNWTFVESSLDVWTALAFREHGGNILEAEVPRQFGRKVRFLRKCLNQLPSLSNYSDDMLPYIDKAKELSEVRRFVAHGTLASFDAANSESFLFTIVDTTPDKLWHVTEDRWFPGTQLVAAGVTLLLMAVEGQRVSQRLLAHKAKD